MHADYLKAKFKNRKELSQSITARGQPLVGDTNGTGSTVTTDA